MMPARKQLLLSILAIGVAVPALPAWANRICAFHYTEKIKNKIVLPVLKQYVGPTYFPMYDLDNPVITPSEEYPGEKNFWQLTFHPTHAKVTPAIGVLFDTCKKQAWVPWDMIE